MIGVGRPKEESNSGLCSKKRAYCLYPVHKMTASVVRLTGSEELEVRVSVLEEVRVMTARWTVMLSPFLIQSTIWGCVKIPGEQSAQKILHHEI